MKLAKITTFYADYLRAFYEARPQLARAPYAEQLEALNHDAFGWFDVWSHALAPHGYEAIEITLNATTLQRRWAREHGMPLRLQRDLHAIAIEQMRRFGAEILWYDHGDTALLRRIRESVPSLRRVIGWTGSPLSQTNAWRDVDLMLSCAPEAVARLRERGLRCEHIDHAFDPRIEGRLGPALPADPFVFIGQVVRGQEFHSRREQLLIALTAQTPLAIYSPTRHRPLLELALRTASTAVRRANAAGLPEALIALMPHGSTLLRSDAAPFSIDPRLRPRMRPGVFGLDAYRVLRNSLVSLNVHANSSPTHASNMRLFEITGVGACMLTDQKCNLSALFEPDRECVAYDSVDECVEKVRYLLDHPDEARRIGQAGRARTLAEHTYAHRAPRFDALVRAELARS